MVFGIGLATFGLSKLYRRLSWGRSCWHSPACSAGFDPGACRRPDSRRLRGRPPLQPALRREALDGEGNRVAGARHGVDGWRGMGAHHHPPARSVGGGARGTRLNRRVADRHRRVLGRGLCSARASGHPRGDAAGPLPPADLRGVRRPARQRIEGTILLLVFIWRLPNLARNLFRLRHKPILLMSAAYTFGFIIVFSPFLNLGILARQRSQLMPFLIAWLIGAGWGEITAPGEEQAEPITRDAPRPGRNQLGVTKRESPRCLTPKRFFSRQPRSGSDEAESSQPAQHPTARTASDATAGHPPPWRRPR